jgi:hypothetical protein
VGTILLPMVPESRQTLIIRLQSEIARAARAFIANSGGSYAGLDELVEVALVNQLSVEGFDFRSPADRSIAEIERNIPESSSDASWPLANAQKTIERSLFSDGSALNDVVPPSLADPPQVVEEALFVLTNRMSPIKIAARALAIAATESGAWPGITEFHERASALARDIGVKLRRNGSRRWVGYPIGKDLGKARERFINSFTITLPGGRSRGPMALLGLAGPAPASEPRKAHAKSRTRALPAVGLTEAGWQLAMMPSPILGECDGETLSSQEAGLLTKQLLSVPRERSAVCEFLALVRRAGGVQARVDELMAARESSKSADLVIAERAALVGRLADLQLIHHQGRGADARINLTTAGRDLQKLLEKEQREA